MHKLYLDFAKSIAREAGDIMRANFQLGMHKEWKEDNSPLTATDIAINDLVIKKVAEAYPDHAVLGEEASSEHSASHLWVVDPVDGTIPFSHGVPTFAFSLALVINGEPQVGVVYDVMSDRLLSGEKGKGAFLNDDPLSVSVAESLKHTVVGVDGPWAGTGATGVNFYDIPRLIDQAGAKIIKPSCMVYCGIMVALGEFSAAILNGHFPWDVAALKVIIEEAGGKVTNLRGEEQPYDKETFGAILSNSKVHQQMVAIASQTLAD